MQKQDFIRGPLLFIVMAPVIDNQIKSAPRCLEKFSLQERGIALAAQIMSAHGATDIDACVDG